MSSALWKDFGRCAFEALYKEETLSWPHFYSRHVLCKIFHLFPLISFFQAIKSFQLSQVWLKDLCLVKPFVNVNTVCLAVCFAVSDPIKCNARRSQDGLVYPLIHFWVISF